MPVPADEPARLQALRLYRILDSGAERMFDDLVQLAAAICETPIAAISLVDEHRQWFKAKVGLDVDETARDIAFCAHAICGPDLMVVPDAAADPRFAANPLVTGAPRIRFYAGAPLTVAGGHALGTVCVIDRRPRQLSPSQLEALGILQRSVTNLLELRRAREDLLDVAKMLPICSWCRSVKTGAGEWVELHKYLAKAVPVTHGMCPDCFQRELGKQS